MELYIGLALMALGLVLLLARFGLRVRHVQVKANGGSIAVGGNNKGSITNVNLGTPTSATHGTHWLTVVAILVEVIGIAATAWHAWHLVTK